MADVQRGVDTPILKADNTLAWFAQVPHALAER